MVTAVLIDTVSIQQYVFASNRLKENLGASYLVESIYEEVLEEALEITFECKINIHSWRENPEEIRLTKSPDIVYETGYIGGGNALLLFKCKVDALKFIRNWTKLLLIKAPGLQTAVALEENFNLNNIKDDLDELFKQLVKNKNEFFPNTILPKHSITADCPFSGLSAEVFYSGKEAEEKKYISSVSKSKIDAAELSQKKIKEKYKEILGDRYSVTSEIDKLGQIEGQSHVAIVHIDGNKIGERFKRCSDLVMLRKLSRSINDITQDAFGELLNYVTRDMDYFEKKESGFNIFREEEKLILPIRPIVIAGDDVTFVTDGRLGVHLAEKFIEFWTTKKINGDNNPLTACAGVAINRTKYPFFRGYKLAEELCTAAKHKAYQAKDSSMLDFHIVGGGFSGNLSSIIKEQYQVKQGDLNFGPYFLNDEIDDEKCFSKLKHILREFNNQEKWPRSKIKELRTVLPLGREATEKYIFELETRGLSLPNIRRSYHIQGWDNGETPYYKAIELLDFYPLYLLNKGGKAI